MESTWMLYGAYGYGYPDYGYSYDDGYYGTEYGPATYYAPAGYAPATETVTTGGDEAAIAACAQRFRTYDPQTQTYIARPGVRRSCP